ncbi:alpha/beta fold hydrolase [Pseudobacillus badius]|uniref:alpha/beta fold hydrolase n=1 Tax=Bacillus badius TaxID=1455 RepID=UPI0007B396A8|nr:alpha/beta fold hydrolase [Bacillus badius]KZR59715.1 alpha/beta hydrolase [Bacillus badius]
MKKQSIYKSDQGKQLILQQYEQYLQAFPLHITRDYVPTRFGRTHVLRMGKEDGKPLFILQGGNCIHPMTLSWFSPLLKEYKVYAPDTIGHPGFSDETRVSAKDDSFALWLSDLLDYYDIERAAFIGPSYGGGIILRLAAFFPERIACSALVSPAGVSIGSKVKMIKEILLPLFLYKAGHSSQPLETLAASLSNGSMQAIDQEMIGLIFTHVSLEQNMPKLTTQKELAGARFPILIVAGEDDIFFPAENLFPGAAAIFGDLLEWRAYHMGHFPSPAHMEKINTDIKSFLIKHY